MRGSVSWGSIAQLEEEYILARKLNSAFVLFQARQSHKRIGVTRIETTTDNQRIVGLSIPNAAVKTVLQDLAWVQEIDD
ncbi:hypothetical protein HID58_093706 [Brassica napus]|uniref:Uncharacterized protein n=1 Tax=Brassica napus TaxID=3708 RepID=A0ABQ7XA05_BRANA|nr:hypothetical protein HID58_093706 [Brassica napus]